MVRFRLKISLSMAVPRIFIWMTIDKGVLGRKSPSWVQGRSPGRGMPRFPKAEAACRHCLQILTTGTIKIKKFRTIQTPDSWPVCFTVGAKWHVSKLSSPSPATKAYVVTAFRFDLMINFVVRNVTQNYLYCPANVPCNTLMDFGRSGCSRMCRKRNVCSR